MSEREGTFGARYATLSGVDERMALEAGEARREQFRLVDAVLDRLIASAMRGERIAKLIPTQSKKKADLVELSLQLSDEERSAVSEHFEVANQEKRGSWHVPEDEILSLGLIHTVYWTGSYPRLALNLADSERAKPEFRGAPEAVAVWVLEPLFEELFLPLKLRGWYWLGKKTVEQQEKHWATIDPLYSALGLDPEPLAAFRPGTGWSRHGTDDILELRKALIESWAAAPDDVGARYRAYRLGQVIDRYYAKAKNGTALRRGVLTKAAGRTLTAYFGGDWLTFLAYLGEEPHQNEEIVQALPATKLMVGTTDRASKVAAEHGLAPEEVQRMLAAYWQQTDHSSPVEQRVDAINRFWTVFDELHAAQRPGMSSLWGLFDEVGVDFRDDNQSGYDYGSHRRHLPAELNADIERLWGTSMLPRWPERLVSEPAPHARLAEALGPALTFWHGAALTAWFLCEGPYSRTDMDGLANYHHRELDALKELGCPIAGDVFRELREAEQRLKPKEPAYDQVSESEVVPGMSISIGISMGPEKLEGFEELRDIITGHRRAWTEQYLASYVRARWESDLRAAGDAYNRLTAQRGKPPTPKQFAKAAAPAANLWFAGNLTGVYSVLGLKSPVTPTAERVLPANAAAFARRVFDALGGEPSDDSFAETPEERQAEQERHNRYANCYALARQAVDYIRLEEALGRPPELKEFGSSKFKHRAPMLADDIDEAWRLYGEAVHRALNGASEPQVVNVRVGQAAGARQAAMAETPQAPATGGDQPAQPLPSPGWYADPNGTATWRWWDGSRWTDQTA